MPISAQLFRRARGGVVEPMPAGGVATLGWTMQFVFPRSVGCDPNVVPRDALVTQHASATVVERVPLSVGVDRLEDREAVFGS